MRRAIAVLGLACAVAWAGAAEADGGGRGGWGSVAIAGGGSVYGTQAYGADLSGFGWVVDLEVGLAADWSASVDVRRHNLSRVGDDGEVDLRGRSRELGVTLRHAIFVLDGRRFLDVHAGVGTEGLEVDGHAPARRRYLRTGVTLLQPGSLYHLSDRLELGFAIDVVVAGALREVAGVGCTGPCTASTAGAPHDYGVFGTFTLAVRP